MNFFKIEFHLDERPGHYDLDKKRTGTDNHRVLNGDEMVQYYLSLIQKYPSKIRLDRFYAQVFSHIY